MTEPTQTTPGGSPSAILAAVQETINQSRALGLTWTLRMATVVSGNPLTIVFDGDDQVVPAVSMQGILSPGLRIFVFIVPPSGNFVAGFVGASGVPYRATQTMTSATSQVSFLNIPTSLQTLEVFWTARSTNGSVAANLRCRVNADTTTVYNNNFIQQNNAALAGNVLSAAAFWQVGVIGGALATGTNFGSGHIVIPAWNRPHPNLNQQHTSHFYDSAPNSWYETGGGLYFNTGSYTQLNFACDVGNLDIGSQFLLLGWP